MLWDGWDLRVANEAVVYTAAGWVGFVISSISNHSVKQVILHWGPFHFPKRGSSGCLFLWLRPQDIATCSASAYLRCLLWLYNIHSFKFIEYQTFQCCEIWWGSGAPCFEYCISHAAVKYIFRDVPGFCFEPEDFWPSRSQWWFVSYEDSYHYWLIISHFV